MDFIDNMKHIVKGQRKRRETLATLPGLTRKKVDIIEELDEGDEDNIAEESHRESEARDNPGEIDKKYFTNRHKKRRETLATITDTVRNNTEVVPEESKLKEQRKKLALSNADISKSVGKRLALFDLETHISPDNSEEELNAYSNDSFQPDLAKSAHIDLQRFGDKGKLIGQFDDAKDITYVSRGRTLITDLTNSRVQMCNKVGRAVMLYAGDDVAEPWASSITHDCRIAVTSLRKKCVQVMDEDGCIVNTFGNKFFQRPSGIAVDKDGRFIVTDALANRVSIHTSGGKFVTYLGARDDDKVSFSSPRYVCCSAIGDIIVSDTGNHCVKIFDQYGNFVKSFGEFGSNNKEFKFPYGVCTNQFGDIFVADHYNNRVSLYNSKGIFVRHILTSLHGLIHPQGVAFNPDFTLYVTHGHLKAHEILSIKLTTLSDHKDTEIISHV